MPSLSFAIGIHSANKELEETKEYRIIMMIKIIFIANLQNKNFLGL